MTDNIKVEQNANFGSKSINQIAEQNNYYNGMTPEQASKLALDIFMDNFPKLKEIATNTARQRAEELTKEFILKLSKRNITDLSSFSDPDVQYILWETHRDYARLGNNELLNVLSDLIADRIQYDKNSYMKIIIDRALQTVNYLTSQHLDYLSVLFILKNVKFGHVNSLESLSKELHYMESVFHPCENKSASLLNSLGCLELSIIFIVEALAQTYRLDKNEVEKICPPKFAELNGDNTVSHIGTILAIANAKAKSRYHFDPKIWIH